MKKKTRITIDNRINLQAAIAKGISLHSVCKLLKKNRTTIYRELTHYYYVKTGTQSCSHCVKFQKCRENGYIRKGQDKCLEFEALRCDKLKKYPYVCNGCNLLRYCKNDKRYYDCSKAEAMSLQNRVSTRKRKLLSKEDISIINNIVSPLIKEKGQSIHHVYVSHPVLMTICSERTIRRLIYDRYLDVKAHDLPRYVRFEHKSQYNYVRESKVANIERMYQRTYTDFLSFTKRNPDLSVVQYDSVIGLLDDYQAILTITFPKERFQFGRIIKKGSPDSVQSVMNWLFKLVGYDKAKEMFKVNLADNGIEFSYFHKLEQLDVRVYFTNPYRSTDKAACERNHEFIRYIIPKGNSLDDLTQEDVNLMFSHINSYVRKSNQNKTPYELIVERFGPEFVELIGIKRINPNDVVLKPKLLKNK
jgi:IS30 family transposase